MAIWVFRVLFFLVGSAIAFTIGEGTNNPFLWFVFGIALSAAVVVFEWLLSSSPMSAISSVVFGSLSGILFAVLTVQILDLAFGPIKAVVHNNLTLALMAVFVYWAIAFLYQTRDTFRVIIPYVEFRKEEKGARPVLLDTSVIVDGRIAEILATRIIDGPIIVPQMVLQELHNIADSDSKLRRERGRLGMRMLDEIRSNERLEVRIEAIESDSTRPVDERLVEIAKKHNARIMTNDYNLNRLASLEGIEIININELANALKPVALPDEELTVKLLRPGEQSGQGVGYLDDGTMVIVEDAAAQLGKEVTIVVTNTITRDTGRMIFGRIAGASPSRQPRPRSR